MKVSAIRIRTSVHGAFRVAMRRPDNVDWMVLNRDGMRAELLQHKCLVEAHFVPVDVGLQNPEKEKI